MSLRDALVHQIPDVPKDFKPAGKPYLAQGTNGQNKKVWTVTGTGNWDTDELAVRWSHIGWEFDSKQEAQKFYEEHRNKK